jgi:hypothetical protein
MDLALAVFALEVLLLLLQNWWQAEKRADKTRLAAACWLEPFGCNERPAIACSATRNGWCNHPLGRRAMFGPCFLAEDGPG